MKTFEAPTISIKEAILKDIITASEAEDSNGSNLPGVPLPEDPIGH